MNSITTGLILCVLCVCRCVLGQVLGCLPISHPCTTFTMDANGCTVCATAADGTQGGSATLGSSPDFVKPCIMGTTCDIECIHGYESGPSNTCQYCVCYNPGKYYTKPCVDQPPTCNVQCTDGYVVGQDGCQMCQCAKPRTADLTTTEAPAVSYEECIMRLTSCQLQYPFGFMTNKSCDMCIGKDEIYGFSQIPETWQPMIKLSNPCIQGFDTCRIVCKTGYRTGPRSCQYCSCNN